RRHRGNPDAPCRRIYVRLHATGGRGMSGPLAGVKVVEIVGLGAAPFCAMMLADMGAQVIRIDRPGGGEIMKRVEPRFDVMARGRRSVAIDLKKPGASEAVLDLVAQADIVLEGFRP